MVHSKLNDKGLSELSVFFSKLMTIPQLPQVFRVNVNPDQTSPYQSALFAMLPPSFGHTLRWKNHIV